MRGVFGEKVIHNLSTGTIPCCNHLRGLTKMSRDGFAGYHARIHCTVQRGMEVFPSIVAQFFLKVASCPVLHIGSRINPFYGIELRAHLKDC